MKLYSRRRHQEISILQQMHRERPGNEADNGGNVFKI